MSGGVFLVQSSGALVEMRENDYDSESVLQDLLARYPRLLAGEQINATTPPRFLLVAQEFAVPDMQDGSGRWALDHLFLDQDGIPTLVEVKRSSDIRLRRREVVAQMLDYAANGVAYWPVEKIQAEFEARCERTGKDAEQELIDFLGPGGDTDKFWRDVKTNLQADRLRLIFVADAIPPELQRIIEYLNRQMTSTEVLGVAIPQFAGEDGHALYVPRVVGQTAQAQQNKGTGPASTRQWDEPSFLVDLSQRRGEQDVEVAHRILRWAEEARGLKIQWGTGKKYGGFRARLDTPERNFNLFDVNAEGNVWIPFDRLKRQPPFDSEALRREFQKRLNTIPGVQIDDRFLSTFTAFKLALVRDETAFSIFTSTIDWLIDTAKGVGRPEGGCPKDH